MLENIIKINFKAKVNYTRNSLIDMKKRKEFCNDCNDSLNSEENKVILNDKEDERYVKKKHENPMLFSNSIFIMLAW